jgi:hypothetical protein
MGLVLLVRVIVVLMPHYRRSLRPRLRAVSSTVAHRHTILITTVWLMILEPRKMRKTV